MEALSRLEVPVPAYEKQRWFDRLQGGFSDVATLRSEAQAELEALLPAVLDRAFRGEL
ncbi:MAG: hypothetical protein M3Q10_14740 [Chloroflexota bacterium]|nr:hypothetical protein [Chloroflexota bacterium]